MIRKGKNLIPSILQDRPFVFLCVAFFFEFANIAFLYLYPLALDDMETGHHEVGLVMGIFSVAAVLSRPLMGRLTMVKGEYWAMSLGTCVSIFASLTYTLIQDFGPAMLFVRIAHGMGFSAFIAGSFALAAKTFSPLKRGQGFSLVGASLMAAVALAPPFGELLIRRWGFSALYTAAAGAALAAWWAAYVGVRASGPAHPADEPGRVSYLPLLRNRSFVTLLISTLVFAHSQSTVSNFVALAAEEKGGLSGPFFFGAYATAIGVLLTTGTFIDRFGKPLLLTLFYPVFALSLFLIPGLMHSSLFWVPGLLFGVGMGFLFSTHNALAASHGGMGEKPAVMSVFTAVYDSGFITGGILSGFVAHHLGLDGLFISVGALAVAGFLMVLVSPLSFP